MAVHMVRILCGPQSSWPRADVTAAVEGWLSEQAEWTGDSVDHSMTGVAPPSADADWWRGDYRLTFDSDPTSILLQKLEDTLVTNPDWYRIGYHECGHDEALPGPCSWDEQREWTAPDATILSEEPTF
jgi:hypothetical protein